MTLSVFCTQVRLFYNLGRYVHLSRGCGFPYLAKSVYTYLCTGKCTDISAESADAPDTMLKFVLEKVHFFAALGIRCWAVYDISPTSNSSAMLFTSSCETQVDDGMLKS